MAKSSFSHMWFSSFVVKTGYLTSIILAFICIVCALTVLLGLYNINTMDITEQDAKKIAALDTMRGKEPPAIRLAGLSAKTAIVPPDDSIEAEPETDAPSSDQDEKADDIADDITIDRVVAWLDVATQEALINPIQGESANASVYEPSLVSWYNGNLCPLRATAWANYRDIARKLVVKNYGGCGWSAKLSAKIPLFYKFGIFVGALVAILLILASVLSGYFALRSFRVTQAYNWLYRSNILS